jgi:hypothetical protein
VYRLASDKDAGEANPESGEGAREPGHDVDFTAARSWPQMKSPMTAGGMSYPTRRRFRMIDQPAANDNGYDLAAIEVLAGLEPVTPRPSMNVGGEAGLVEEIEAAYAHGEITTDERAKWLAWLPRLDKA